MTTAWLQSLSEEMNYRVKGTEMLWTDPDRPEAILHVRAATLRDDERLIKHLGSLPGYPLLVDPNHADSSAKKSKADLHPSLVDEFACEVGTRQRVIRRRTDPVHRTAARNTRWRGSRPQLRQA